MAQARRGSGALSFAVALILAAAAAACGDDLSARVGIGSQGGPSSAGGIGGTEISGTGGRAGAGATGTTGIAGWSGGGPIGGSGPPLMPGPCADIFSDDQVPTYELQIAQSEWDALMSDFRTMQQNVAAHDDYHPYHYLAEFKYGNEVIHNALIRLKGWSSWWQSQMDDPPKLQFVIAFNEIDSHARFHGLRKIELDMPRIDPSYLRQRIALSYLRSLGVPAQCANSARVFINGAFYGLYTNLERPDQDFITRVFPGADHGDLWDYGGALQTNTDTMGLSKPRLNAFWSATDAAAVAAITDMDEALLEWASEAMLGDPDGYWIGHANWLIYDHPTRGWLWIPHDLDATIDWLDPRIDPMYYWAGQTAGWAPPWQHYVAVLKDDNWREHYVAALRRSLDAYVAAQLPAMVDRFAAQIRDAVAADPTRPFTFDDHRRQVDHLRQSIFVRIDSIRAWLDCRAAPDGAADADLDGRPFCMDCRDTDPTIYPGAPEICGDTFDQDCDGTDLKCN